MLTPIQNDLHNIAVRLKEINRNYRLFRNTREHRFEVHNSCNPNARTLCFVPPFDELDERTLVHAWRTSIENYDDLATEFDAHNRHLSESAERAVAEQKELLADMMDLAQQSEHEVVFGRVGKWF